MDLASKNDAARAEEFTNNSNVLLEKGDKVGARYCCEETLRIDPDHLEAHYRFANLLLESGDKEKSRFIMKML